MANNLLVQAQRLKGHKVVRPGDPMPSPAAARKTPSTAVSVAGRCPTAQEILTRELEKLYQQPTPYESMPEAQAPVMLKTRLHQHQLKALAWMLKMERKINVAQLLAENVEGELSWPRRHCTFSTLIIWVFTYCRVWTATTSAAANSTAFFYQLRRDHTGRTLYYK